MRDFRIVLLVVFAALSGCSSAKLKVCDSKVADPEIMLCKDQVSGHYWKCEKPADLFRCQDPQ